MTNGCICCTLRDDLLKEVRALAESDRFDYLLIESTGIAEPLPVAATFEFRDEDGESLSDVARARHDGDRGRCRNLPAGTIPRPTSQGSRRVAGRRRRAHDGRICWSSRSSSPMSSCSIRSRCLAAISCEAARKIIRALNPDADIVETSFAECALRTDSRHRPLRFRAGATASALVQGIIRLCQTIRRRPRNTASAVSSIARVGRLSGQVPSVSEGEPGQELSGQRAISG